MTVETRYMRNERLTVNGLLSFVLGTSNTTSSNTATIGSFAYPPAQHVYVGIRVWKRTSGGVETEITAGSAVAVVDLVWDYAGSHSWLPASATWNCPQTSLATTDSIIVRVYGNVGVNPPTTLLKEQDGYDCAFQTEQLGASSLDSATWTVNYYIDESYSPVTKKQTWSFSFGTSNANSNIANFTWTPALPASVASKRLLVGVGL